MYNIQGNRQGLSGDTEVLKTVDMRYPQHELDKENKLKIAQAKAKGNDDKTLASALAKGRIDADPAQFVGSQYINDEIQNMSNRYTNRLVGLNRSGQLNPLEIHLAQKEVETRGEQLKNMASGMKFADANLKSSFDAAKNNQNIDQDEFEYKKRKYLNDLNNKLGQAVKSGNYYLDPNLYEQTSKAVFSESYANPERMKYLAQLGADVGTETRQYANPNNNGGVNTQYNRNAIKTKVQEAKNVALNDVELNRYLAKSFRDKMGTNRRGDKFVPFEMLVGKREEVESSYGVDAKGNTKNPALQEEYENILKQRTEFDDFRKGMIDNAIDSQLSDEVKYSMTVDYKYAFGSGSTPTAFVSGGIKNIKNTEKQLDAKNLYLSKNGSFDSPFYTQITVENKNGSTPMKITDVPDKLYVNGNEVSSSAQNRFATSFQLGITRKTGTPTEKNKFVGRRDIEEMFAKEKITPPPFGESENWTWANMNGWVKGLSKEEQRKVLPFLMNTYSIGGLEQGTVKLGQSKTAGQKTQGFASNAQMEQAKKDGKATPIEVQQSQSQTQSDQDVPYSATYLSTQLNPIINRIKASGGVGMETQESYRNFVKERDSYQELVNMNKNISNTTPASNTKPKEQVETQPQANAKSYVTAFVDSANSYLTGGQPITGDQKKGQGKNKGGK